MHLEMSSAKWRPFCLGLIVLTRKVLRDPVGHFQQCRTFRENAFKVFNRLRNLENIVANFVVRSVYADCRPGASVFTRWWPSLGPIHDGVMKWKHFPLYWPFVRRNHRKTIYSLKPKDTLWQHKPWSQTITSASVDSILTHWGPVTHICVGNLTIIGSDNSLSPGWCQTII